MAKTTELLVIEWRYPNGMGFWGCHSIENDGRISEWQVHHNLKLVPVAAVRVTVTQGEDATLLEWIKAQAVLTEPRAP